MASQRSLSLVGFSQPFRMNRSECREVVDADTDGHYSTEMVGN